VRVVLVIAALAAIVVGQVQLRRVEDRSRHDVERLQLEQVRLRRVLYEQQAELGEQVVPREVRRRADDLAVGLVDRSLVPGGLAGAVGGRTAQDDARTRGGRAPQRGKAQPRR